MPAHTIAVNASLTMLHEPRHLVQTEPNSKCHVQMLPARALLTLRLGCNGALLPAVLAAAAPCCGVSHAHAPSRWLTTPSNSSITRRRWSAAGMATQTGTCSSGGLVFHCDRAGGLKNQHACVHEQIRNGSDRPAGHAKRLVPATDPASAARPARCKHTGPHPPGCLGSESDCARMMCSLYKQQHKRRECSVCRARRLGCSMRVAAEHVRLTRWRCTPAPPES